MKKQQILRSIVLTIVSIIVSFITFLQITRNSNIKIAEALILLVLGMGISALIFNIAYLVKLKKNDDAFTACVTGIPNFRRSVGNNEMVING